MSAKRVFIVVVDGWGVGALPDADRYGDLSTANTMGNIDQTVSGLTLPTFQKMGLGNLLPLQHVPAVKKPMASYGKMAERSDGKDTTTGHWEMAGIYLKTPFPTYPQGFPEDVLDAFKQATGVTEILGNCPASGTTIIEELGLQHLETGHPIIYTSADSVFQIAAHIGPESRVTLAILYDWCEKARALLTGKHQVSRVIARPFEGTAPDNFTRVSKSRRDYAILPPAPTTLNHVEKAGGVVVGVGKIEDIFCFSGLTHSVHTGSNAEGIVAMNQLACGTLDLETLRLDDKPPGSFSAPDRQLVFVNLVETDSHYGHRRDVDGYARALEQVDAGLGTLISHLGADDLLLVSADHGCDPTARGSDHTREYVPVFLYNPQLLAQDLGIRESFADIGKTVLKWLDMDTPDQPGNSLLPDKALVSGV
jgi:phosphopentomutase